MLFNRLVHLEKLEISAKEQKTARAAEKKNVELCEDAKKLPAHIQLATDPAKLNAQIPYFVCPEWAGLPSTGYHLYCMRQGIPLPALDISRFPYYLFGRNSIADYVLDHPSISGVHAALIYHRERECFIVLDINSTNGVRVNRSGDDGPLERITTVTPIPLAVGAKLQFGYSTRVYELRRGKPPGSKRLREEQEAAKTKAKGIDTDASSAFTTVNDYATLGGDVSCSAVAAPPLREDEQTRDNKRDSGSKKLSEALLSPLESRISSSTTLSQGTTTSTAVTPASCRYHLYQIVLKHKDVHHPVSRGVKKKGARITRCRDDAVEMAWCILQGHQRQKEHEKEEQPKSNSTEAHEGREEIAFVASQLNFLSSTEGEWSTEEFIEAVKEYSEIKSKNDDGDLGLVEKGTYHQSFDDAAFQLQRHCVSSPVETPLGIHLIFRSD